MLAAMIAFGLNIPINKYLYQTEMLSPMAVVVLRMSFAALVFWLISFFTRKEKVEKRDMLILFLGGVFGMVLNQGLFAYGLSQTSSVDASIITTSGPLFAMILAAIILKEPITAQKFGGVIVGGLGAVILVYSSSYAAVTEASWQGNLSILSAQAFYSTYLVITRPLAEKYSSFTIMKWMFLFAAIIMLPVGTRDVIDAPLFQQTNPTPYWALAFVLLGATVFTYMLIPFAQQRIRPTTISMYNNLQPLIASGVAIAVGMDSLTIYKVVAAILIFVGVYMVTMSKSKKDLEEEKTAKRQ